MSYYTLKWCYDHVSMLDQRLLPQEEIYLKCHTYLEVAEAIKTMVVRGAPAIGCAAAMGIALGLLKSPETTTEALKADFGKICSVLSATRPTAVNLFWAVSEMEKAYDEKLKPEILRKTMVKKALDIYDDDLERNRKIGFFGKEVISDGDVILTHCNAGSLAVSGYGTALGVIRAAHEEGKKIEVYADETRPFLQGARLTAWELMKDNIPVTLITDNMAGYFMGKGVIKKIIVGSDRIAANGDIANKIGTYSLSVLANYHGIPLYIAAPKSTIDMNCKKGADIPIEERASCEVTSLQGKQIAPKGVRVRNPAFDVTPAELITGIITEDGILSPPFPEKLKKLFE